MATTLPITSLSFCLVNIWIRAFGIEKLLCHLGLGGDVLDAKPTALSVGQQQRVALARALRTGRGAAALPELTASRHGIPAG